MAHRLQIRRRFALAWLAIVVTVAPAAAITEQQLEDSLQIVVMIRAVLNGDDATGAGIIVGRDRDSVFIATAGHVVGRGDVAAERVEVMFRGNGGAWVPAVVLDRSDAQFDLAVLRVRTASDPCAVHLERSTEPTSLTRNASVYPAGYPNGVPWGVPATPGRIGRLEAGNIVFESSFLAGGHSGGALLTDTGSVAGLLKSDAGPFGQAVPMSTVLAWVRERGYPVMLRPPVPRSTRPLHAAAAAGDAAAIERELFTCPEVDARDADGETALHKAAAKGSTTIVARLLERRAAVDAVSEVKRPVNGAAGSERLVEEAAKTPLHLAIEARAVDTALLLLARGASPNRKAVELKVDSREYLPITWTPPLTLAIQRRLLPVVTALIAARADLDATVDTRERDEPEVERDATRTPLRTAIATAFAEAVQPLIRAGATVAPTLLDRAVSVGSDCNTNADDGIAVVRALLGSSVKFPQRALDSGLDRAIYSANSASEAQRRLHECFRPGLIDLLIARGADVRRSDVDDPPLSVATRFDAAPLAALLIAKGASVNAKNRFGVTALHVAATYGSVNAAKVLLARGADVNATDANPDGGETPLHYIVQRSTGELSSQSHLDTIRVLVTGKANLNVKDGSGRTPLMVASQKQNGQALVALLLELGADPNIPASNGWTPLHEAAQSGEVDEARQLLDRRAAIDVRNKEGETPLWRAVLVLSGNGGRARQPKNFLVAQFLVERGANVNIPTHTDYTMLDYAVSNRDFETARYLLEHGAKGSAITMERLGAGAR
jgi:ankyrin repeat protein